MRNFTERQRVEALRPRPSMPTPISQKRPQTVLGATLRRGPEKARETKLPAPDKTPASSPKTAAAAKAAPAAKAPPAVKMPALPKALLAHNASLLARAWGWLQKQNAFSAKKQLRVCETVSLGEKRFVAVVQIEGQRFLIGGGVSGVSMLAELETEAEEEINAALEEQATAENDGGKPSLAFEPIACAGGRSR